MTELTTEHDAIGPGESKSDPARPVQAKPAANVVAPTARRPHVVIVGAGFAGLNAAKGLAHLPVDVTVVDRRNHYTFQPLLYQVALAVLSPADIAQPIRSILRHQRNTEVLMDEVVGIDIRRAAGLAGQRREPQLRLPRPRHRRHPLLLRQR